MKNKKTWRHYPGENTVATRPHPLTNTQQSSRVSFQLTKDWCRTRRKVQRTWMTEPAVCVYVHVLVCTVVSGCGDVAQPASSQLWVPLFHSSSGPWTDRDGQDVWRTVKNNTGHLTSAHVYEFLSPLVHQACVFFQSSGNERFAPLERHPGRSERKTQQLPSFVPLASKEQVVL